MSLNISMIERIRKFTRPGWRAGAVYGFLSVVAFLVPVRRRVAFEAIKASFPEEDARWHRRTLSNCYRHFLWSIVEVFTMVNDPSVVNELVVEVEGKEHFDRLLEEDKGAVVLTAHIGNWELCAAWLCQNGYPVAAAVRDTNDKGFAELIESYRQTIGLRTLRRNFLNIRSMVKLPKDEKAFMAILADQDGGKDGVPVMFLGRPCTMVQGPAAISQMADVPVVPFALQRIGPMKHRMVIKPPLEVEGASRKDQVLDMTLKCNEAIEDMVRSTPEQWLWFHRRWKHGAEALEGMKVSKVSEASECMN